MSHVCRLRSRPWHTLVSGCWIKPPWVLYNHSLPSDTSCHSSSTLCETLCALKCLNIRNAGLLATFSPSLANGTVRNRCYYVRPPSIDQAWPPSWRPRSGYTKGLAGLLHVVSRGDAAFNNDGICAVSLPLLLGRYCIPPHLASTRAVYADANLLLPLSRLPNRKNKIGNLCFYALATSRSTTLGSFVLRGHSKGEEREQGCRPLVSKIFSRLVTALSSGRTAWTHCCTSEHRTEGRPPRSTTSQMSLRPRHSPRR